MPSGSIRQLVRDGCRCALLLAGQAPHGRAAVDLAKDRLQAEPLPHGSWKRSTKKLILAVVLAFAFGSVNVSTASGDGLFSRFGGSSKSDDSLNGSASAQRRAQVIASLPMQRLTASAQNRILSIANSPTIYRQLPTQAITCEQDLFLLITRNPEILVGMWDVMGVTQVKTTRTGPYQIDASDGSGTTCQMDLVYGDRNLHIFVADGYYDGKMVAKPIHGSGVFVFRTTYADSNAGDTTVTGTLDCFVQFDSLGADLIARGLSGFIGRSADANFIETARFLSQISEASKRNPHSMIELAERLPQVSAETRKQFVDVIVAINRRDMQAIAEARTASVSTK